MSRVEWLVLGAAMLVGAGMLFVRLGVYPLWDDEADVAFFARSIAETGQPTAIYGDNLNADRNAIELTRDLMDRLWPQVTLYVTAASFKLFGVSTFTARLPHALLGLATIPALFWATDRWLRDRRLALTAACALAVWVPFVLYARQCRYYAVVMLLTTIMWGMYPGLRLRRWKHLAVFCLLLLALFHSHYCMALAFAMSLGALALVTWNKHALAALAVSAAFMGIVNAPWLVWFLATRQPGTETYTFPNADPVSAAKLTYLLLCGVNRFNVGQVGFLGIGLVVVVLWWRRDRQRSKAFLQLVPLLGFSIVFTAILFPLPGRADWPVDRFLDIRYLGIAIPLFCMGMAVVGGQLFRLNRPLGALVIALFVTTDVLAFRMFDGSYRQANRVKSPINAKVDLPFRSYLGDYLIEFTSKQDSVYTRVLDFLEKHARPGDTILTCPRHHSQVILFYLGDRLKVCGMLAEDESYLLPPNRDRIAPHVYRSDFCPKWILLTDKLRDPGFSQTIRRQRPRYEPHHLGIFRYGVTRPEVGWRTFRPLYVQDPEAQVVILERVDTAGGGSAR